MSEEIKYINKRGYVIQKHAFPPMQLREIRKELTMSPFVAKGFERNVPRIPVFLENEHKMYLPRQYGLQKLGEPDIRKVPHGDPVSLSFALQLLPEQCEPVFQTMKGLKEKGGGLLTLPCGFGKTICGIFMLCHMNNTLDELRQILFEKKKVEAKGIKTLIIVHKSFLMTQWMDRIRFCFPHVKIGRIQGKVCDIEGKDIVIAMIKTLSMKDFPLDTFNSIGMVILDECHRIPCTLYYKALFKINSTYMLGLSATPERRDGLMKILNLFIGEMLYCITGRFKNYYKIRRLFLDSSNEAYCEEITDFRGNPSYAKMLKNIMLFRPRTMRIVDQIQECYEKEGRTVLVLSHEIAHLEEMEVELRKRGISDVAYFIGKLKKDQLKESEKKSILLATYSMADEGMDIPKMNTLILASPKTNIKQAIGRIDRILHTPMKALVIDVNDSFSVFTKQGEKRTQYYKKYGFEMEYLHVNEEGGVVSKRVYAGKQNLEQEWDPEEDESSEDEKPEIDENPEKAEEIEYTKEEKKIMEAVTSYEEEKKPKVKSKPPIAKPLMRKNMFSSKSVGGSSSSNTQ